MIIGISGKMQSGKSTVGTIIRDLLSTLENTWEVKQFSTKVKEVCSLLTGIPVENFEKEEVKSSYLGEEWDWGGQGHGPKYTVRQLLQYVGTNAMRDVIHPDVWCIALMKDYKPYIEGYPKLIKSNGVDLVAGQTYSMGKAVNPNWIISDVRFENECKAVKDRQGIVIRVNRPCSTCHTYDNKFCSNGYHSNNHISETSLDTYNFDYVIENDSDIPSLIEKVKEMLIHFKIL